MEYDILLFQQKYFRYIKYVGTLFLSMLKCIIIPLVIATFLNIMEFFYNSIQFNKQF